MSSLAHPQILNSDFSLVKSWMTSPISKLLTFIRAGTIPWSERQLPPADNDRTAVSHRHHKPTYPQWGFDNTELAGRWWPLLLHLAEQSWSQNWPVLFRRCAIVSDDGPASKQRRSASAVAGCHCVFSVDRSQLHLPRLAPASPQIVNLHL